MNDKRQGLIITPHSALKAYLELALEDAGLSPVVANSLREAFEYLKTHVPRLIVVDEISEGELDAAGFVWRLKRITRLKRVPTIQIIHKASERERVTMEISGSDHIVELPIKNSQFRQILDGLLSYDR